MTIQDWQNSLNYVKTLHEGTKLANLPFTAHCTFQEAANNLIGYFQHELNEAQKVEENASKGKDIPPS